MENVKPENLATRLINSIASGASVSTDAADASAQPAAQTVEPSETTAVAIVTGIKALAPIDLTSLVEKFTEVVEDEFSPTMLPL